MTDDAIAASRGHAAGTTDASSSSSESHVATISPEIRCTACSVVKPASEYYRGRATCKTCVRARASINSKRRYIPRPHVQSSLTPPENEPAEKACKACGETKPITAFGLDRVRYGVVMRRGVCRVCRGKRKRAVPPPVENVRRCGDCGLLKPKTEENFYFRPGKGLWHGLCRPCMYAREKRRDGTRKPRVVKPVIEVRTIIDPELDMIRKALSLAPPELSSEPERLAFLRGFMRGATHGLKEGYFIEQNQDLVFRIASELRKHTYEDRVSFGYEALLACSRSGIADRDLIANEIREKITSEKGQRWMMTGMHSLGKNGDFDLIAQTEDYRETEET